MKKIVFYLSALMLLSLTYGKLQAQERTFWLENYEEAVALAQEESKPLMIMFSGLDWCYWCKKLDGELFSETTFLEDAHSYVIPVRIDFPRKKVLPAEVRRRNESLQRKFKVRGYPTVVYIDQNSGSELARHNYIPNDIGKYMNFLEKIAEKE